MPLTPYYSEPGVTIYHGRAEEIVPELEAQGQRFTALLGDPPYGIRARIKGLTAKRGRIVGGRQYHGIDWPDIEGDDRPFDPAPWTRYPKAVLWGANNFAGLPPSQCWFVWDKLAGGAPHNGADVELAWTNLQGPARLYSHLWRGIMRAGEENASREHRKHPMQKPVNLMRWVIAQAKLSPADLILSSWCGSAPEITAAREAGVPIVAIDCAEWCCEVAARRCAQALLPLAARASVQVPLTPGPHPEGDNP